MLLIKLGRDDDLKSKLKEIFFKQIKVKLIKWIDRLLYI